MESNKILPPYHNTSILLVEDNDLNKLVFKTMLKKLGCQVDEAENGKIALNILENNSYDALFIDLKMPVMNGFELIRELRKQNNHTPAIAITASQEDSVKEMTREAGMDDIIFKPARLEIIAEKLYQHLPLLDPVHLKQLELDNETFQTFFGDIFSMIQHLKSSHSESDLQKFDLTLNSLYESFTSLNFHNAKHLVDKTSDLLNNEGHLIPSMIGRIESAVSTYKKQYTHLFAGSDN